MSDTISGIHHVTAIASDAQRNLNFYAGVLGLRLVKRTVNFDDPATYHFYYGDRQGKPGTILTFFPWQNVARGRQGTGQATALAFSIPENSVSFWLERFVKHNVPFEKPARRFDEQVIAFRDPDNLALELIATNRAADQTGWQGSDVPAEHSIRGFHTVTLCVEAVEHTMKLLTETMKFRRTHEENNMFRLATSGAEEEGVAGTFLDVRCAPDFWSGVVAGGTVHHVAWRVEDDAAQLRWREIVTATGLNVTPVLDRQYFRSIYFREPGGILFEIATDAPGFAIDESIEELGTHLKLPAWLERARPQIERVLPPLHLPSTSGDAAGAAS